MRGGGGEDQKRIEIRAAERGRNGKEEGWRWEGRGERKG